MWKNWEILHTEIIIIVYADLLSCILYSMNFLYSMNVCVSIVTGNC